jgi:chemotaxis protein CheX
MEQTPATLTLPAVLDLRAVAALKAQLLARSNAPLDLDAAQVERVGGLGAQLLIAVALAWRGPGAPLRILNATPAFREDIARLGAADLVLGSEAS